MQAQTIDTSITARWDERRKTAAARFSSKTRLKVP